MKSPANEIVTRLTKCFERGNRAFICGNGGSAQQANHFAAELVHEGYPAISLCSDISVITAIANDEGYENIFRDQLMALAEEGDILICLSTSGKSKNILKTFYWAKCHDLEIIDFPRKGDTAHCQEYHLHLIHKIWRDLKREA